MARKYNISLGYLSYLEEIIPLLKFIDEFNKSTDKIEVIPQQINTTEEKVVEDIINTPTNVTLPDLIILHSENIPHLAEQERLAPIKIIDEYDYYDELLRMTKYKDSLFALPLIEANPYVLLYNNSIFHNNKIEKPPSNWQELIDIAKLITKDTDNDGLIDQWGYIVEKKDFILFLLQNECELLQLNRKEAQEALSFLLTLSNNFSPPHKDFNRKDCGMITTKPQYIKRIKNIEFTISSLPQGKVKSNLFADIKGVKCIAIINKTKEKNEAAQQFIDWFNDTKNYTKWCMMNDYVPVKKSVIRIDCYQEYLTTNKAIFPLLEELKYCKGLPAIVQLPQIRKILDSVLEIINFKERLNEAEQKAILDKTAEDIRRIM